MSKRGVRGRRRGRGRRFALAVLPLLALAAGAAALVSSREPGGVRIPFIGGGPATTRISVDSRHLGRTLDQVVVEPAGSRPAGGRPLLMLLHGRGMRVSDLPGRSFDAAYERLGERAPAVVFVNGGDHSYYHDRRDGRWGAYVMREVLPAAIRELGADPRRVAIGGMSMGGWGAFDLARLHPKRFCAVGGHSAALWRTGGETPEGAFDDDADFARHDLFNWARSHPRPFGAADLWIDTGDRDPFKPATESWIDLLKAQGARPRAHIWPGEHNTDYWNQHMAAYINFYTRSLARCRR